MLKYLLGFTISAICLISAAVASDTEQIHFLALDIPQDTANYITTKSQVEIQGLIAAKAPEYSDKILYHTSKPNNNIHISLIRFNEIPTTSLLQRYIKLFEKNVNNLPNKDIADKISKAKLCVTDTGFIIYKFDEPKSLTTFVTLLINDLKKNKLYYKDSDFQEGGKIYPHFSVAYFNPNEVSVEKMRKILNGKVPAPKCNSFVLNEFCLKHSEKLSTPLTYSTVHSFKR